MDLSAPIVPGESAAGITIGDEVLPIIRSHSPKRIQQTDTGDVFHFNDVIIWSSSDRKSVFQIAVFGKYSGTTEEGLKIHMPTSEVADRIGPLYTGEYDEICIKGYAGLGVEVTGESDSEVISHIIVCKPSSEQAEDTKPDNVPS